MAIFINRARQIREQQIAQLNNGSQIINQRGGRGSSTDEDASGWDRVRRTSIVRAMTKKIDKEYRKRLARAFAGQKVRKDPTQFERKAQRTVSTKKGYGY